MVRNEKIITSLIKRAVINAFKALERFPLAEEDITVSQSGDSYKCAIHQKGMTAEAGATIRCDADQPDIIVKVNIILVGFVKVNRSYYSSFSSSDGENWELKNLTTSGA